MGEPIRLSHPSRAGRGRLAGHAVGYALLLAGLLAGPRPVPAQELEPRKYANLPVGTNIVGLSYIWSDGDLLFDPAVPIEEGQADIQVIAASYVRSFGLLGRNAKLKVVYPWLIGDWNGTVDDQPVTRHAEGPGDAQFVLEWNVVGAPALDASAFRQYRPGTVMGTQLRLTVPTGEYDNTRLINLGANRYALRAEVGLAHTVAPWTLEAYVAAQAFSDNDDFAGGQELSQDPIYSAITAVVYSFPRRGLWAAVGAGYGKGGRTEVNGDRKDTEQSNWLYGAKLAIPLAPRHGLSLLITSGLARGVGTDFNTASVTYTYLWGN